MKVKSLLNHFVDDVKIELYTLNGYKAYIGQAKDLKNAGQFTWAYSDVSKWHFNKDNVLMIDIKE